MALNCTQYGKKKKQTMQTFYFAKYVYVNVLKRERERSRCKIILENGKLYDLFGIFSLLAFP